MLRTFRKGAYGSIDEDDFLNCFLLMRDDIQLTKRYFEAVGEDRWRDDGKSSFHALCTVNICWVAGKKKDIVVFIEIFSGQIGDRIKSKDNNVDLRRLSGCDYASWKTVTSSEKKSARVRISIYRPPRTWNLEKLVSMNSRVFSSHNSKYGNDIHNPSGNIFTLHA